jgi:hypothetical protein
MKANTLTTAAVIAAVSVSATAIYVGVSADPEPQIVREVIYLPAPTTSSTSTTTTSTTTTTTTTLPPKPAGPAKSSLAAKIDEWSPGTSSQVSATALKAGGQMACNMWEAGPTSRMSVMRETAKAMGLTPDQLNIAALVAQAVLYTGCRAYANFMEGPIPFDCMGNGKICD